MSSYRVTDALSRQYDDDMRDDYHPLDFEDFDPAALPMLPFDDGAHLDLVSIMRLLGEPVRITRQTIS